MMLITGAILHVLWSSLAASVLISIVFALAILGFVRWTDLRAEGQSTRASAYALLAGVAVTLFIAGVAYGLILVTQKG